MAGILIVDDMPAIRAALARVAMEHAEKLQPVLKAATGEEAVQLAHQFRPDIILMDIKLPGLTGLQATARIRENLPDTKIIILTAYDDFSYAQKALKLGARDYLLKPVRPKKLAELLHEVMEEIHAERRDMRTVTVVKDSLQKSMRVIESSLVENLIRGTTPEDGTVHDLLAYLGKRIQWPVVLVTKVDDFDSFLRDKDLTTRQRIKSDLVDLVRQQVPQPQRTLVGYSHPGRVVTILSTEKNLATTKNLCTFADNLRHFIAQQMPFTVTIGIGNQCSDIDSIPLSYAESNLARRFQSQQQGNRIIHIDDVKLIHSHTGEPPLFRVQREQQLVECVQKNQQQQAQQLIGEIVDFLAQQYRSVPDAMKNHCTELVTLVAWGVIQAGVPEQHVLSALHQQVRALESWESVPDIHRWTRNSLAEMLALVQRQTQPQDTIQQAVEYIHLNFHRSDISLQEIAQTVNLSPSHLSAQFKSKMGVSYVRYLTVIRLQEAEKLLLTTGKSVAEVAAQIGYPNVTNFYRHFRKQFDTTPGAYRQQQS